MSTTNRLRVLVVEDDEAARANLCDILELDDYAVTPAGSAGEAFARDDWQDIFAILLDRRLPDAQADDLLPQFRRLAPEAAVLIITGLADLQGAITAIRQGATDYLLKPIDPDLLRASLARVAERRRLAAELRQAEERARQAERLAAIGEVYTGLAHESRNALQRSQACLELLAKRLRDRPELLDLIARIQRAQDQLHELYEEVRTYAAPLNHLDRQVVDLGKLVRQAWEDLAGERQGRRAELFQDSSDLDLRCSVDGRRLGQVFRNILENALSACTDPVTVHVRWTADLLNGRQALSVALRDNGPGLTPEASGRIFEPFYTTKTHGTGLGMAIARRIVEAHGGHLGVGVHSGPGAEIIVTLPRDNS
jgi:signal transduction histidine kinase